MSGHVAVYVTLVTCVFYKLLRERRGILEDLQTEIEVFGENSPCSTKSYKRDYNNALNVRTQ